MTVEEQKAADAKAATDKKEADDAAAKKAAEGGGEGGAADTATPEQIVAAASGSKSSKMVPEADLINFKKQNKELIKTVKDLQTKIASGASGAEISEDLAAIGKEFDVDPTFLGKLAKAIRSSVEKERGTKTDEPDEENDDQDADPEAKKAKINELFEKHFTATMSELPEYEGVVNKAVIKRLSLLPENAKKTFRQIIEDTYSGAISGKRTIDSTTPGGGKDAETLDFDKARVDSAYFDKVMANPKLKADYNKIMLEKGF